MQRIVSTALACAVALSAASAFAAEPQKHDARVGVKPNAIGGAQAPNAQLAALIDPDLGVIRSKGVIAVSHTQRGIYCITPAAGIDPNRVVPVVSVDYSGSSTNNALVQYRASGANCAQGRIEVITFDDANADAFYTTSNIVGFTIVVP